MGPLMHADLSAAFNNTIDASTLCSEGETLRAAGGKMTVCFGAQVLFRSVSKLLMDTATAEYLFCCDFFQEDTIFTELFTPTLAVVESSLAASIQVPAPPLSPSVSS